MQRFKNSKPIGISVVIAALLFLLLSWDLYASDNKQNLLIGAYYYDGWTGTNSSSEDWAIGAPRMLTKRMNFEFPDREPIWGWRDDDLSIMERQIDLASKNGIDYFVFCWYWTRKDGKFDEEGCMDNPRHVGLNLFMKAKNRERMKFAVIICNHEGSKVRGKKEWEQGIDFLATHYLGDKQYLNIEGEPYISFFQANEAAPFLTDMNSVLAKHGLNNMYAVACNYRDKTFDLAAWYNNTFEGGNEKISKDYQELVDRTKLAWKKHPKDYVVSPTCLVGWDKRPWFDNDNYVYYEQRTPEKFLGHLKDAIDFLYEKDDKVKLLQIYAWNEMGEGGYLVPTKGDPKGNYLKQVKKAKKYAEKKGGSRIKRLLGL